LHQKAAISTEILVRLPSKDKEIQKASINAQTSLIDERISLYQQMLLTLSLDRQSVQQPRMVRSGSLDALQDTFIRQTGQAISVVVGAVGTIAKEADTLECANFVDRQRSLLPTESRDAPQVIASLQQSYFIYKRIGAGRKKSRRSGRYDRQRRTRRTPQTWRRI
jgi:hypothetical protein